MVAAQHDLLSIQGLVEEELKAVNHTIQQYLNSSVPLIETISAHLLQSGGKRLRPLLVLLSAKACQYTGTHHILLAAIIEFIHSATLLHDDVVDTSTLRRGKLTANALWGNASAVLVGDFFYSRAFQMMVQCQSMNIMNVLSQATSAIVEGEVLQLVHRHQATITVNEYHTIIEHKTAKLFEVAARLGALLGQTDTDQQEALAHYGLHLGLAFQLIDDALDYAASGAELGKHLGDDLAEGKTTLPLIYAMAHGTPTQRAQIASAIEQGCLEDLSVIQEAITVTGALEYTKEAARKEAVLACSTLDMFPKSEYIDALFALADFAVNRHY